LARVASACTAGTCAVKVATAVGSETTATTTEEYDRQGRLWKVTEPSGSGGGNTVTTYTYDVGGRLKQASTPSGVTQNRIFTYDNRGFLTSEQLPEVGTSGNGTVTYSKYDARGHARRKQDGAHDLAFTYDRAERLTQVAQADASGNPGTPVLTTLVYATANTTNNYKNGKLETATAANPELTASVVETYTYGGLGGRVSARQTLVETRIINQAFTWNDLGQLASLGYPNDTALADAVEPPRTVSYTYANGVLTAVPSFLSSISYHPNGMVNTVTHANGTRVVHGKDPNDMARPASITLQRGSGGRRAAGCRATARSRVRSRIGGESGGVRSAERLAYASLLQA
jgi:YD repeat-containing protein